MDSFRSEVVVGGWASWEGVIGSFGVRGLNFSRFLGYKARKIGVIKVEFDTGSFRKGLKDSARRLAQYRLIHHQINQYIWEPPNLINIYKYYINISMSFCLKIVGS